MRKFEALLCFILAVPLFAQQNSNLFQVITSDLPIERNIVFRDLQTMLENENAEQLKGISLPILHTLIEGYKNEILKYVQPLQIKVSGSSYQLIYLGSVLKEFNIEINSDETVQSVLLKLDSQLKDGLSVAFNKVSAKILPKDTAVTNILFYVSYVHLYDNKGVTFKYVDTVDYKNLTASLIAEKCENYVQKVMTGEGIPVDTPIVKILAQGVTKLNEEFAGFANALNDYIVNIFDKIQTTINNEVEKPLSQNLKGLTGFSASQGTGTFTGGALYSFSSFDGAARLSVYTNANFNTAKDSAAHSLIGLRGGYISKNFQFDVLASMFFGDKKFKAFEVFEIGGSLNYGFSGGSVLGIAGFYTDNGTNPDLSAYSIGVMFKISPSAPAAIIGFSALKSGGRKKPIIQISYPINTGL